MHTTCVLPQPQRARNHHSYFTCRGRCCCRRSRRRSCSRRCRCHRRCRRAIQRTTKPEKILLRQHTTDGGGGGAAPASGSAASFFFLSPSSSYYTAALIAPRHIQQSSGQPSKTADRMLVEEFQCNEICQQSRPKRLDLAQTCPPTCPLLFEVRRLCFSPTFSAEKSSRILGGTNSLKATFVAVR